jgi:hypothetical protein
MNGAPDVTLHLRPPASPEPRPPVSVIIPLPADAPLPSTLIDRLPADFEIIVARGGTRASAMNTGAGRATGASLWFVHADTVLGSNAIDRVRTTAEARRDAIRYFDLRFDGGGLMRLTDLGVMFRSRILGLPFGDQALLLPTALFQRLGGYPEDAPYGEDHLLVWRAHQAEIPVRPIGAVVGTNALKYRVRGWLPMTLRHLSMTVRQAWPEWRAMRRAARSGGATPGSRHATRS